MQWHESYRRELAVIVDRFLEAKQREAEDTRRRMEEDAIAAKKRQEIEVEPIMSLSWTG